ncbi:peptidase propeptide and YPEB domain protein [Veillonella atypica ACS-049-V-Sch6]|uniref:Peptidase propeptide and YPEB domain protein n=1 Tax=Veillonella atypica ACS-049-V-Sch6 TaxID=866776 RepID=E1L6I4_9FIRM|nr:ESPR-type extended signal peptide-containing protein [Veillonella atypica]EFL56056.1 peptidase propeptide and YPEB domain protein [Veillonella atypica ACS-049-V-Sch6]
MNKIFKVIWSKSKQCYIVVSEIAKNKTGKKKIVVAGIFAALSLIGHLQPVQAIDGAGDKAGFSNAASGVNFDSTKGIAIGLKNGDKTSANGNVATVAIGAHSNASGSSSVAIGGAVVDGAGAIGLGWSTAKGNNAVALGGTGLTNANGNNAFAASGGNANGESATAIGSSAIASGRGGVAVGWNSQSAVNAVGIGFNAKAKSNNTVAIGVEANSDNSIGDNSSSVSIGVKTRAREVGSMAMGVSADASGKYSIALGSGNVSGDYTATANYPKATGEKAIAIGYNSNSSNTGATAIGAGATASGTDSFAGGSGTAGGNSSIAIGKGASITAPIAGTTFGGQDSIAMGTGASAKQHSSVTIGVGSTSDGVRNITIGPKASASGVDSIAIGNGGVGGDKNNTGVGGNGNTYTIDVNGISTNVYYGVKSVDNGSIAFGNRANAAKGGLAIGTVSIADGGIAVGQSVLSKNGVAIGSAVSATAANAVAMGSTAEASSVGAVAIGGYSATDKTKAQGNNALAIGANAVTNGNETIAIGKSANASNANAVAFGKNANASIANSVAIGSDSTTDTNATRQANTTINGITYNFAGATSDTGMQVSVGAAGKERQIKNVAAGEVSATSTDAINGSQLFAVASQIKPQLKYVSIKSDTELDNANNDGATADKAIAIGPIAKASSKSAVAIGNTSIASSENAIAIGNNSNSSGVDSVAIGPSSVSNNVGSVAVGKDAQANGAFTVALGGGNWQNKGAQANGVGTIALGTYTRTKESTNYQTAVGFESKTDAESATAIGYQAVASGKDSVALGTGASTTGQDALTFGHNSQANGDSSLAMGIGAQANSNNAIALGYQTNSNSTNSTNGVFIGSVAGKETNGVGNIGIGSNTGNKIIGDNNVSIGTGAGSVTATNVYASESIMLGTQARAINSTSTSPINNVIAIGKGSSGGANSTIAIGQNASSTNQNSIAIGTNASAPAYNGVAIGSFSVANTEGGTVEGYNANASRTDKYAGLTGAVLKGNIGAVSIGSGGTMTRQIKNLAAGTADTDAVNVAQLKSVNLAFKGNAGTGDVNLAANPLTIKGNDSYITTNASGNTITISANQKDIHVISGTANADTGVANAKNVATAINDAISQNKYKWYLTADNDTAGSRSTIDKEGTVKFSGDPNITVARSGNTITSSLNKIITVDTVKASKSVIAGSGNDQITLDGTSGTVTGRNFSGQSFAAGNNVLSNTTLQIGSTTNGDNNVTISRDGFSSKAGTTTAKFGATGIDAGGQRITNVTSGGNVGTNAANITDVKNYVGKVALNIQSNSKTGTINLEQGALGVTGANGIRTDLGGTGNSNLIIGLDKNTVNATTNGIGLSSDSGTMLRKFLKDGNADFKISGDGGLVTTSGTTTGVQVSVDKSKVKDLAVEAVTVSKANTVDNPITVTPTTGSNSKEYAIGIDTTKLAAKTNLAYTANGGTAKTVSLAKGLNFVDGGSTVATVDNDGKVSFDLNTATKNQINTNITDIAANKGKIATNTTNIAANTTAIARNISLSADSGVRSSQSLSTGDVAFNVKGATGDYISTKMNGNTVEISTTRATINSDANTGAASVTGNDGLATAKNVADAINKAADAAKAGSTWNVSTNGDTSTKVSGGDTVDFTGDNNITVDRNNKTISTSLNKNLTDMNSISLVNPRGESIFLNGRDGSIKAGKAEFKDNVGAGSTITSDQLSFTNGATGANEATTTIALDAVSIQSGPNGSAFTSKYLMFSDEDGNNAEGSAKGLAFQNAAGKSVQFTIDEINAGGNKIQEVAEGTDDTDAVNVKQLKDTVASQTLTYRANTAADADAKSVKLSKGLDFVDGTMTKATVDNDGKVTFDINDDTKTKINDSAAAVNRKVSLGADSGTASSQSLKDGDVAFNVKGATGDYVSTNMNGNTVEISTTRATINSDTNTGVASVTGNDGLATAKNVADAINKAADAAKAGAAWNFTTNSSTTDKTSVQGGDTVDLINGDNIVITQDGTDKKKITVATKKDLTVDSVTAGNTVINTSGLTNGTTAITGSGITTDKVTVGGISLDKTDGINAGGKAISNVASGGTTDTNAANIGDVKQAVANLSQNLNITDGTNNGTVDLKNQKLNVAGANGVTATVNNQTITVGLDTDTVNATTKGIGLTADTGATGNKYLKDGDVSFAVTGDGNLVSTSATTAGVKVAVDAAKVKDLAIDAVTVSKDAQADNPITVTPTVGTNSKDYAIGIDTTKLAAKTDLTYRANNDTDANAKKVSLAKGLNFVNGTLTTASIDTDGVVKYDVNTATITAGTDGTVTGPTTDGVATAQNVADAINAAKKASKTEITANTGEATNATTGNVTLTSTTAADGHTIYDVKLNDKVTLGTATNAVTIDGTTGKVIAKNAVIGGVTVDGDNKHVTGLSNTTWNGTATTGRAATEDQLKAVADTAKATTDAVNLKFSGDTNTAAGVVNLKDDTFNISGDGKYVTTDANGKDLTVKVSEAEVKKSAVAAVTVSTDTTDANNPISVTPTTSADGTTKDYKVTIDGTKIANKTNLSYKANDGTAKQVSLADGLNFKNGTLTTASIDDNGVVKYDVNTAAITAGADGTITGPTTDGVTTAKNVADAINAAKKASKTEITANTGEVANATTGNVSLTSTTAADGHTIYDVKLNDKVTLGTGANAVTIDGTTGAITGKTATIGGVTVNGTANTIGGLSNTTWNGTATTGRAATEDQLKAVADAAGSQTWEITADKKAGTSGAQTGTKENAKVGKDDTVSLIAGENLTVDQASKNFTYSLNKDLVKMNSATFEVTGGKTTVIKGDSIVQTDGANVNTTNATSNTITDGTNTSSITAGKAQIGTVGIDGVVSKITTGGTNAVVLNGADGTVKTGNVIVTGGATNNITGLSNTTLSATDFATKGRAATEEQLKAATGATTLKFTGDVATNTGSVNLKDDTFGIKGDGKYISTDVNGKNVNLTVSEAEVKKSAVAAVTVSTDTTDANNPLTVTPTASADGTTKDYKVTIDGTKIANKTNLSYKANDGTAKQVSLADGLNFKNGTLTTASIDDNGVVKYDVNTASITAGTDGTITGPTTDGVATAKNVADAINAVKKASKTEITANTGEVANATTGNVTLTSTTAADGHTIYDVKLNDKVTLGSGANAVTIDGTTGTITGKTANIGGVTVNGTANTIGGLSNTTWNGTATTGRAATEDQLKAVADAASSQTWNITADKAGTTGAQTGTKKNATVGKDETVELVAGDNLTINQNERKFTYSLNKDLANLTSVSVGTGTTETIKLDGATGKITAKNASIGGVTIDGDNNHVTGLANTTWNGTATTGRAATEDQLKAVADTAKTTTDAVNLKFSGDTNTSPGVVNLKDDTLGIIGDGKYVSTDANGKNLTVKVSEAEVKKSAVAAVTVSTDTTDANNPLTVTPTTSADGTTKDYKVTIDGTKIANKTNLSYKANDGTAKQVSLADGLNFKNGTLTTASIDDNGVVKYDVNTASITAGADGTITGPTTDGVATAQNVADAINAAKKASKTEITANTGEAASATTGNVTLTSTTAADGHTIYDIKLNDKVTLGSGTNAVTIDGTTGAITGKTATIGGVTVNGTANTIGGLSNTTWNGTATTGRAATEDQLKAVADAAGSQTWKITADKKTGTSGAQTGTKENAKVGKDDKVSLIAGENLTVDQAGKNFTYSLNTDLVKMNSATFLGTGANTTVITGDSITQTAGTQTNTSTADGNTVADGTKSTKTTADGQVIKDGAKSNKSTVDNNVIDDGNGNVNTSNATSNTITDGTNTTATTSSSVTVKDNAGNSTVITKDNVTTGVGANKITLDGTAGKATIGSSIVDGVNNTFTTGGANAVTMNGAAGTVKTGTVTVTGGTTNDITGLSNTTVNSADFATKGRAATEEQLKAATGATTLKFTGDVATNTGSVNLKDDIFGIKGDGKYISTDVNGKNVNLTVSEAEVKKSAVAAVTVSTDTIDANNPLTVTPTTSADGTTKDYKVTIDGTKIANKTNLSYKANNGTAKQVSLADGLDFTNGTLTTASIDDKGVVKYDVNTASITAGTDGTITGPTTDGVATAKNVADAINAAKKASKTEITANTGEAANATTGNVSLTSTTAADGHTIYDVKLNDKVTLGTGANAVTIDGTAGKATIGSSIVDGVNNTFTTGGASPVTLNGATGTITGKTANIGGVTVDGTNNHVMGLANKDWTPGVTQAVSGRAATEDQLQKVSDAVGAGWKVNTGKITGSTGESNGAASTKVASGEEVQFQAGNNLIVDQNGKTVAYSLNKALKDLESATFNGTGTNKTVITGDSITQTAGTQTNTSTAGGNTIADGTKSTKTTADGQVIKDGTKTNTSTVDENTIIDGTKSNKSTVDGNTITDGTNTTATTSSSVTVKDNAGNSTIITKDNITTGVGGNKITLDGTAGKATIGSSIVDGVNNTFTTGGTNAVALDGGAGTVKTGTVTVTGGTTNDITGLSNTTVTATDFATKGRAATEEQLKAVGEQTWQITADKDTATSGAQTGTKKDAKVGKDDKVQLIAGENMTVNQNERDFTFTLNKDLVKMNSATFLGTGTNTTVITGDSITQTAGTQTNTSTAAGNTVANGANSTATTAAGTTVTTANGNTNYAADGVRINTTGKTPVSLTDAGLDNGNNVIKNVASGHVNNDATDNTNAANIADVKKATTTVTANAGEVANATTGNVTLTSTAAADGHTIYDVKLNDKVTLGTGANAVMIDGTAGKATVGTAVVDGVNNIITTGGASPVTLNGATGTIIGKTANIGGVTVDGTNNHVMGLANKDWTPGVTQAVSGRAATEDQLQKVSDAVGAGWKVNTGKVTGSTGESNGAASTKVASGEEVQFQAGNNLIVDQNGKTVAYSLNKALKDLESATFNGAGTNKTVITGDSITQTAGTQTNTSTAAGNTVADGTKSTKTTADGQVIKDGTKTNTSTVDENTIVDGAKSNKTTVDSNVINDGNGNVNTSNATSNTITDGTNTVATTSSSVTVKDNAGNSTVITKDNITTGVGANKIILDGAAGTIKTGTVTVTGGTTNDITGLSNTTVTATDFATKGRAATEEQLKAVGEQTWQITADKKTGTSGAQTGLKENAKVGKDDKVSLIAGENLTVDQAGKNFTYSLNSDLVKMNSATFLGTGTNTTVITGDSITQTAGSQTNTSTAGGNTVADGTKSTEITAAGQVIKDGAKSNKSTVDKNVIDDGTGNVNTSNATSNTITDGTNTSTIAAGKATIGSSIIDGVNNTFTTGGASPVTLNGATGTITGKTANIGGVTVDGTNNHVMGLANKDWTPGVTQAVSGRAATEDQLQKVSDAVGAGWKVNTGKVTGSTGESNGATSTKVSSGEEVQFQAGNNLIVDQNGKTVAYSLNKALKDLESATFNGTGTNKTVITGDSITQTSGTQTNTSTAGGNTVADGTKSTETTAAGQVIKDGTKSNKSTVDNNVIDDGTGNINTSNATSNTVTDGTNTTEATASTLTVKDNAGNSTVITKDNITTGVGGNKITLDGTAGKATIGSSVVDGVNNTFTTGGTNAVTMNGAAGTIKTGAVTVTGGTTNDITGLSNTTVNSADFATKGRAATEEQLKAVGEQTWQITADKDATTSGAQTGTKKDAKVGKDDKVQLIAGENMTVNQNERDFTFTLNKDLVKMNSATFEATGGKTTVIKGDSIVQTDGTKVNTSTAGGNTVADGTKSTETTAAGQVIKDGTKTNTSTVDENTIVDGTKSNKSTVDGNTITDGTNTTATTSSSVTVKDNAGNSTVITKDNITTGVGANKVTLDGTAGKATIGSSVIDGVNNTFTTGGANAVKLDGAAGTIKTGTVTVTGGTTNDITGLSNTTVNSADFATKGRAATEEQLKAVGEQTWQITADKDATTSGAQTGTKKDAKVGKDDKVQLIAGENMTVNQNERDFTFTLNKDLVKMNSATFLGTGSNTTVITGNSITQTAGTQTNISTAAGNTIANGTKSTETTADGQVIKDGAKSNKSTVDSNVIDDGNGNVNTSNATSNTITDGTNTSTITAGKANIGNIAVDGVNNKITMGNGATPVTLDGANGHLDGLTNTTWVPGVTKATTGRAATEDQLQQVSDAVGAGWKVNTGTVAGSSGVSNGAASTKVSSGEEVKLQAGDNLVIDQNGKTVSYSLNKDLTKMNSATFEATGGKTTVIKGDSIVQTDGGKTNTSNAAGNTVVDGNKSTATTAAGTTITDGAKTNTSTADKNVIDDGAGNKSTFTKDGITITKSGKDTVSLTSNGLDNGKNKIVNVAAGVANTDAVNVGQLKEYAAKSTTELTANGGQPAGSTTGNIVLTKTTAADGHTIYDNKLNDKITLGTDPTKAVTVDGTTGTVTGLTNKTWTPGSIVSGRAATEDQLKDAVADSGWKAAVDKEGSGQSTVVGTSPEKIKAEETVTFKAGNNMMVTQTGKSISYAVNPELTDMKSATFKDAAGNTTVTNGNGITITPGSANPTNPHAGPVSLTKDGLNNGNNQIKGVAPGTDPTDAVNVSQLNASNANTSQAINQIAGEVQHVGAHAAAMAALKPIQYDPLEPTQVMAGVGNYRGETAAALGLAHYTNENTMFNVGVSVGGNHNMVNAGVTHKFGYSPEKKNIPDRYKAGPISSVYVMQDEVSSLKKENAEQKYVIADQAARLTTLEAENEQQRRELAETKKGLDDLKAAVDKLLASKG